MNAPDPRLIDGLRLIRACKWFEAHEALEDLWRETEASEWREHLQGVIQQVVALEHLQRGNPLGCFNVWSRARGKLKDVDESAGMALGAWGDALKAFYGQINLADRVKQQLEGGVADGDEHLDMGPLPPSAEWPQLPLSADLEARLSAS